MAVLTCPSCGTETEVGTTNRTADDFCPKCDYPLFWVQSTRSAAPSGASEVGALRRLPGAAGRRRVGTRPCPSCGELNPLGRVDCLRCGTPFGAKKVAPPSPPWWPNQVDHRARPPERRPVDPPDRLIPVVVLVTLVIAVLLGLLVASTM